MSAIKNDQIYTVILINKILNGPGTSFQSPELSQKHIRNAFHTAHKYLTKFHFDSTYDSKEIIAATQFQNLISAGSTY